ncbi:MAG: hypothetical protein Q9214_001187 [Letrouitia sp. 1 TL-2023]
MNEEDRTVNRRTKTVERFWNQVRARFLLSAVFGKHCRALRWYGTLPPRAESTVICMQIILNVILCAVSYSAFPRNLYWDGKSSQIWRLVADRTGYLSYANIAVFFAFGIRNNILIWLTGWSFATFNRFHRWIARVATLEAILHSVGYTVFTFISTEDGFEAYKASWAERYWWTGVVATILMSLLPVFSILWLRRSLSLSASFIIRRSFLANMMVSCGLVSHSGPLTESVGISVGISHIYSALEQNPEAKLRLTWTCRRSSSYMDSVMEKELKSALETDRLAIDAYVTGAVRDIKGVSCKEVAHGRPNVAAVIHEAAMERRASLAVVVCGPASLADDARAAFVAELRDRQDDMDLFMEAFNW